MIVFVSRIVFLVTWTQLHKPIRDLRSGNGSVYGTGSSLSVELKATNLRMLCQIVKWNVCKASSETREKCKHENQNKRKIHQVNSEKGWEASEEQQNITKIQLCTISYPMPVGSKARINFSHYTFKLESIFYIFFQHHGFQGSSSTSPLLYNRWGAFGLWLPGNSCKFRMKT